MSNENENVASIQREILAKEQAKEIARQQKLARDVRDQIAKAGHYNPANDPGYIYEPYPKWIVHNGKELIVRTKEEHDQIIGRKTEPAKAVEVDISALAQHVETAKQKRKYTRKQPVVLPQNLE